MQFPKDSTPSSFLMSADFSSYSKSQCVAFVSNTFSYVLSLCINCNFKTKWQSCKQIPHLEFLNSLFSCLVFGCLRDRYRGTQECNKVASPKSSVVFGRPEELSKGHVGIGWSWPCLYLNHEKKQIFHIVENQGRADQANWTSCFCPHGRKAFGSKQGLLVVDGTVNQQRSIGNLRQNLLPWARATFQRFFLLVHNNDTPHIARNTHNFLSEEAVEVIQRPARSPDLNPIEHIWEQIKDMDTPPTAMARLREALP